MTNLNSSGGGVKISLEIEDPLPLAIQIMGGAVPENIKPPHLEFYDGKVDP